MAAVIVIIFRLAVQDRAGDADMGMAPRGRPDAGRGRPARTGKRGVTDETTGKSAGYGRAGEAGVRAGGGAVGWRRNCGGTVALAWLLVVGLGSGGSVRW